MTTLTPLAIVAAVVACLQTDDPITAGAVLLFALVMAGTGRRRRPHRSTDKLI
jgi:MYXO-CTERM domain-containing protein